MRHLRKNVFDVKDNGFYEELETALISSLSTALKFCEEISMKSEEIFRLTIGNKSSHEISSDNGIRVLNFFTLVYQAVSEH
jgi:hypothetical protein